MSKRSNGEGAKPRFDEKRKRWYCQIMDGFKPNGRKNMVNFTGATEKEVIAKEL